MILEKYRLDGKVALITGGSRGIGRAIALGFAEVGADVVVVSRNISDLEKVAAEVSALGRRSLAVAADLSRIEEINNLVANVKDKFSKIDILVNNAGTTQSLSTIFDADEALWDEIMNLNLKGQFFLSQSVAKVMKEHGGGTIINISSMVASKPEANLGIYSMSKSALSTATTVMAIEWGPYNIRVNAIAPGNIHTRLNDFLMQSSPTLEEKMIKRTPLRRFGEPDEITCAAIYLASEASSFITAATILADGGFTRT